MIRNSTGAESGIVADLIQVYPQRPLYQVLWKYIPALLIVGAGTLLRLAAKPYMAGSDFAITLAAMLVAAWVGGLAPSLIAQTLVLYLEMQYFGERRDGPPDPRQFITGVSVFYFVGTVVALLSEFTSAAKGRARRAADLAHAERERLQATLVCMADAVLVTDAAGDITLVNPAAESVLQSPVNQLIGQSLDDAFRVIDQRTGERIPAPLEDVLRFGRVRHCDQCQLVRHSGESPLPINFSAAPIRSPTRDITGAVIVIYDQSERQRMEEELRTADRRKDEFLATLAHELRNPLAPIRTGLDLLKIASDDPELVTETVETMERQTEHMVRLIDDLLDVSRITRGKLKLQPADVFLAEVVREAVAATRPLVEETGHSLAVDLPAAPVPLRVDPQRLAQAICNLLSNAAKFTPAGGKVAVTAERTDGQVVIAVTDTGIGIPPETCEQIFEMFTQLDRSPGRAVSGLGIGLSLARSIVEMHGGTLTAHSAGIGHGSQFEIRLPVVERVADDSNAPGDSQPSGAVKKILVVDDNEDARESLARLVEACGHAVKTAANGLLALETAESFRPDAVFMDLEMPQLDGYETARRMRQAPWGSEMVLVAISGWGQTGDQQQAQAAGFDRHLVKPVPLSAIEEVLDSLDAVASAAQN